VRSSGVEPAELVAVVDLGSTAVRCWSPESSPARAIVCSPRSGVPTRLGAERARHPPREAIDATLRPCTLLRGHFPNGRGPRIVAIATSAVRDAENRERLSTRSGATRHRTCRS